MEKSFPGVRALDDVSFDLVTGEIHALVGENGAGKSTLLKILAGIEAPDAGTVMLDGRPVRFSRPRDAYDAGIRVIHQEFSLVPHLSVAENITLHDLPRRGPWVDRRRMRERAGEALGRLLVDLPLDGPVHRLGVAGQQLVEIAKALDGRARVFVMDEPTAALTSQEIQGLFSAVRRLASQGVGIIFVSHRLEEVMGLADRITVLRDGQVAGTLARSEATIAEIVRRMVGREIQDYYPERASRPGTPVLRVERLRSGEAVRDVSFELRSGEVLGLAGLVGAGRTEVAEALFGLRPFAGRVEMAMSGPEGRLAWAPLHLRTPRDAIRAGIGLVPEDRKLSGLVPARAIRENVTHPTLHRYVKLGFVRGKRERAAVAARTESLNLRAPSLEVHAEALSGGNQQKVVLAKWLEIHPRILVLDEPTRGVDVGAKAEIYRLIRRLTEDGVAVLLVSSDIPELLALSDRVTVLRSGVNVADLDGRSASHEAVLSLCLGEREASA